MFENRRWLIIPTSLTSSINFSEVLENSPYSLRLSIDKSKTFIKYDITQVTSSYIEYYTDPISGSITSSSIEEGIYGRPSVYNDSYVECNFTEINTILNSNEWTQLETPEAE
jgi:uncharacterized phage protein gp47/JayE